MAEDLWKLRKKRGMSVKQLAGKSGVPAFSIHEYEQGQAIRIADLARLAKALFVDEFDIKIQSDPMPAPRPEVPASAPAKTQPEPPQKKAQKPPPLARPSQVTHLRDLARILDEDENALSQAAGKPLADLTQGEIKDLLRDYSQRVAAIKAAEEENRPDGTRRKRAHLPEAVDEYEMRYLQERQDQADIMTFKLLNGEQFSGRIIGFSPYYITIVQSDQTETTLHRLALAYYLYTQGNEGDG